MAAGPGNAEAHNNLGAALLASGDAAAAIPRLRDAIAPRPGYPEAHFNLARACAAAQQFADAIREALVAQAQAGDAGKAELLARIQEQLHRYRAAVKP